MSAKDDFSNNKAKQFIILHGEKVAFGVCLLLVVVFFLLGRGVESVKPNETPSALSSRVAAANQHMNSLDETTWKNEIEEARKPNFNLEEIVIEGRKPIEYTPYYSYIYLPAREPQALREDPNLLPPSKPLLVAINAALAVPPRPDMPKSPLDLLEFATEKEKDEKKPRRRRSDRNESNTDLASDTDTGYDPYGSDPYSDTGSADEPAVVTEPAEVKYRELTAANYRRLQGFKLSGTSAIPEAYSIVVGTATLPIKDQWLEYKRKLENSIGFSPMRDRPIYMWYEVQRQDVTDRPDNSVDPNAWKAISWRSGPVKNSNGATWQYDAWYEKRYGQGPEPLVDLAYYESSTGRRHDYSLTSPIPIILMRDVEDIVLHPDTPKRKAVAMGEPPESEDAADPMSNPPFGPTPMSPSTVPGSESSEGTSYDAGYQGVEAGTSPSDFVDFDPETGPAAPLKLVRFFDIKAKPGRKYRYRVRVALVDPNNPLPQQQNASGGSESNVGSVGQESAYTSTSAGVQNDNTPEGEVSLRWLKKDVRERVEGVRAADEAKFGKDELGNIRRVEEWRYTDWSPVSDVVAVSEIGEEILAGSVTPPKERRIDENVSFEVEEPTGKVVVTEWNRKYAVDVPAEKEVSLGSLLNFTKEADVLDPIKLQIKRIPDYHFKTDAIVLDMRGGQPLPGSDKDNVISAPGEYLVIDGDGQLHAQNELDDMDEFRLKLLMPDEEEIEPEDDGLYGGEFEPGDDAETYDSFDPTGGRDSRRSRRSRRDGA